jgi:protein-L-isoaspartate(D-aspartate) O-methyltransferase
MDLEQARINMLKQQIRAWGVLNDHILDLLKTTPREEFVPSAYRKLAFADLNIPLGFGEVMLTPKEEAYIIQALDLAPNELVLEIGTGSGYITALLAKMTKQVYSIDIRPEFTLEANAKLKQLGITNVQLETGDATQGWDVHQSYDVIVITGSLPILPDSFKQHLTVGGRLFTILGQAPVMEAVLITRTDKQAWQTTKLFETVVPALHNAQQPPPFIF